MALSLVASHETARASSTSYVFTTASTLGGTPATGDLVVICINMASSNSAPTAPTGWTLDRSAVTTVPASTASWWWYSRVFTGSESATYTWTFPSSTRSAGEFQFTGATSWVADTGASYTGTSSSLTSVGLGTSATLASAGSVAVAALQLNTSVTNFGVTGGGTWTVLNPGNKAFSNATLITSSTTALSPTASWTTSTAPAAGGFQTYYGSTQKTFTGLWNVDGPTQMFTGLWDVDGPVGDFTVRTELAWTTDPLTRPAEPAGWTSLGSRGMQNLDIRLGTKVLSSTIEAGRASCDVDNSDRQLDPSNTASALSPNVKPRKRIRHIVVAGGQEVTLFTGFVERWPIEWSQDVGWVRLQESDLINVIAGENLPPSVLEVTTRALGASSYWPMSETVFTQTADDVIADRDGDYLGPVQTGGQVVPFDPRPVPKFAAPMQDDIVTPSMAVRNFVCPDEASFSVWLRWNPAGNAAVRPPIIMLQQATDPIIPSGGFTSPNSVLLYFASDTSDPERQQFRIVVTNGSVQARLSVPVAFQILDGTPHHIVFAFDASAKDFTLWVDGLQISGFTDTGDPGTSAISGVNVSSVVASCTTLSTGWGIDYQGGVSSANATAADVGHLSFFAREISDADVQDLYEAGTVAWDGDTTGERADRVLDLIGVDPADRDIDTGTQVCGPTILGSQNALAYLKRLVTTEQGVCFVSGDGKLTFTDRLPDSPTSVQTFSDDPTGDNGVPMGPVSPDYSWDRIINTVTVGRENGAEQLIENTTSRDAYGPLAGASGGKLETLHQTADAARATGERLVERYAEPRVYIPDVQLEANDDGVPLTAMAGIEIGDATTTKVRPAGGGSPIEQTAIVEAIHHKFPAANVWTVEYSLVDYPLEPPP